MINNTSKLERLGYISNFNPNSNKKTFSKTHPPLFGIGVLEEIAKDDRLSKLKYVYNTEGIIKNLREVVSTNCVDLIIIDSYADLFTGSMNNSNEVRSFLNMYNNIANEF